jgi:hypothetical protein
MNHSLVNLKDYSLLELIVFGVGCFLWIVVYYYTIQRIRKQQFVEIPLMTVCGNIVWEFLWSWVFKTNMGELFQWGYRIWFFMDCFIVYSLFRYGYKQISIPALRQNSKWVIGFGIAAWTPLLYFYIQNYDAPISHMGAYSGYILNVMISALYIPLALRLNQWNLFSYPAAWCKAVGNLLINIFCFLHFYDWFLLSLCVLTTVLDVFYLYLLIMYRKQSIRHEVTL